MKSTKTFTINKYKLYDIFTPAGLNLVFAGEYFICACMQSSCDSTEVTSIARELVLCTNSTALALTSKIYKG